MWTLPLRMHSIAGTFPTLCSCKCYLQLDNFPSTPFTGFALLHYCFAISLPLQYVVWKHCTHQDSARVALWLFFFWDYCQDRAWVKSCCSQTESSLVVKKGEEKGMSIVCDQLVMRWLLSSIYFACSYLKCNAQKAFEKSLATLTCLSNGTLQQSWLWKQDCCVQSETDV